MKSKNLKLLITQRVPNLQRNVNIATAHVIATTKESGKAYNQITYKTSAYSLF